VENPFSIPVRTFAKALLEPGRRLPLPNQSGACRIGGDQSDANGEEQLPAKDGGCV
jgi:hypothetical protein